MAEKKKLSTFRLWLDYAWEKKLAVFLYGFTAFLFLTVAGLYRMENVPQLFYAVWLSAFFWLVAGFFQGRKYVKKRQALFLAQQNLEQLECLRAEYAPENTPENKNSLDAAYCLLIDELEQRRKRQQNLAEEHRTEQNDYYLMWAHQIKTPIAAMKLLLGGRDSAKENFLLKEELFKIEQYVEMVLHFQRLQSMESDLVLSEYDLYTLLKQAVRKYSVLFINKGVSLRLSEMSLPILTDEKWFGFCMEQILSNSIKYTVQGAGLISIYLSEQEADTLVIEDNGIGIRQEDLPRIFERGFTGYNGRMDKKSTGIGLYLCKQILDRLGNKIRVESSEGEGARVYLTLYQRERMPM